MRAEIIIPNGDLQREVWVFDLHISVTSTSEIYFVFYAQQVRKTKRHLWNNHGHWQRLDKRSNNIRQPSIPSEVEKQVRDYFASEIYKIPIQS